MNRKPVRPEYDAVVDLFPARKPSELVYALVKRSYDVTGGACTLAAAEPLLHDIRDPDAPYPFMPGSDFRFYRAATDVVIVGRAFAPGGRPTHAMDVRAVVADRDARIRVTGRRELEWTAQGRPVIGIPEPFEDLAIDWANAYGGADRRVAVEPPPTTLGEQVALDYDHPGVYPRNPFGKGYVVLRDTVEGVPLPNLEDPSHLLTADNVIVHDPARWYLQPRPRAFEWVQPLMFPRYVFLGLDAWIPGPDDARMPEVAEGSLQAGYRSTQVTPPTVPPLPTLPFYQEAPAGLVFDRLEPGTPVLVQGMRPDGRDVAFRVPAPPSVEVVVEGTSEVVPPRLINVLIEPDRNQVSFTYSAVRTQLPRKFVAGIHGHIPIAVRVDGDQLVSYDTPPTVRAQLDQAAETERPDTTPVEASETG